MESSQDSITTADPGHDAARQALADAAHARGAIGASVVYPRGYVPLMAFTGFAVPLLGAAGNDTMPSGWLTAAFLVVGFAGVAASGWALHLFQSRNGVHITGLQSGKRFSVAYMVAMIALVVATTSLVVATGAWWAALIAGVLGAGLTLLYTQVWLADYHRHTA